MRPFSCKRVYAKGDICKAPGCEKAVLNEGTLCAMHYARMRKHNSFNLSEKPKRKLPDNIVKICKFHGELKEDQVYQRPNGKLECKKCQYISRKASNDRNKERVRKLDNEHYARTRDRHLELIMIGKFGITRENYMEMLNKQNNGCSICELPETAKFKKSSKDKLLAIDHCHATNKIRGLLCQKCNITLGMVRESVDIIQQMIEYLKAHQDG